MEFVPQSIAKLLIEPFWNGNAESIYRFGFCPTPFNRTILEWKQRRLSGDGERA